MDELNLFEKVKERLLRLSCLDWLVKLSSSPVILCLWPEAGRPHGQEVKQMLGDLSCFDVPGPVVEVLLQ